MKALVYHGPGKCTWEDRPKPTIQQPTDVIVRITKTTICGTDLHILKGDVPTVAEGRILGHEGMGVVESAGAAVGTFRAGDRVLISCISACGRCEPCKRRMYSHCANGGGWILGNTIDGTQAEYVRIPFADTSLYSIPGNADEEALVMFSDILPTGYECGVLYGHVQPGDTVAIVGAGPVGLAALMTAQLLSPSRLIAIDTDAHRLKVAEDLGATDTLNNGDGNAADRVLQLTNGAGVDVAVEAVGTPVTFDLCQHMVKAGGHLANVGVHGKPVSFEIERLWSANITLTTRLVDTETTATLLKIARTGRLQPQPLITHRFKLDQITAAYDTFANAARESALKVILSA